MVTNNRRIRKYDVKISKKEKLIEPIIEMTGVLYYIIADKLFKVIHVAYL